MPLVALMALGLIALDLIIYFITPRLKPLVFFAAIMLASAALALAFYGCRYGLVLARYAEPPRKTVERFLSALERGDRAAALGFVDGAPMLRPESSPEDESTAALLAAMRESQVIRPLGEGETQGLYATQELEYSELDLTALLADAREIVLARLGTIVAERPYRDVYDAKGAYLPEVTDEAWDWAVGELLARREDYTGRGSLCLTLRYDEELWHILPDEALIRLLGGRDRSLETEIHNAKSRALEGLVFIRKRYEIAETALSAPAPDPACYGSSTDPAAVRAVIDGAAILLDGQGTVWNEQIELFPGSEFSWYYDDSILAICWKELLGGKCCTFAEVKIADGSQIRRKLTGDLYDSPRREYGSRLAEEACAVVASNGDFYAFRPYGITVWQRQLYRCDTTHLDSCFITADGDMLLVGKNSFSDREEVERYIADNDVVFSLAFGPILIRDGELVETGSYLVGEILKEYSRAALGMTGERHYLVMTLNFDRNVGRTSTLAEAGRILYNKGCVKAYALDGGQTAQLWMNGRILNHIDYGTERPVSDIFYFASAGRDA